MCLVAFAFGVHPRHPLVLVANRDERHARATAPLDWWREPPILAGRDLEAGGTWFGVVPGGRFAVVTNVRGAEAPPGAPSRGTLPTRFLTSTASPEAFLAQLEGEAARYAGFNLLAGDGDRRAVLCNRDPAGPRPLESGVHALSNGPPGVAWPKVALATERLREALAGPLDDESLFAVLADRAVADDAHLPDTGVGLALERVPLLRAQEARLGARGGRGMSGFFRTQMGHRFYESTMPSLVRELARLNTNLERLLAVVERGPEGEDRKPEPVAAPKEAR